MTNASQPYLSVNNIEVIYDHVILVLKGVSLSVPGSTFFATKAAYLVAGTALGSTPYLSLSGTSPWATRISFS